MLPLESLKKSDLFSFFNLAEIGRSITEDGMTRISYKTGGFQEHIDIVLQIDSSRLVTRAVLLMDRSWIGDSDSVNPFGKDLAKSFIADLVPDRADTRVDQLVKAIWFLKGRKDTVISIAKKNQTDPSPDTKQAIDVYVGDADHYLLSLEESEITLENCRNSGRERLRITITTF